MNLIKTFIKDESGATAAEYAIMVALIAVAIIAGATLLGKNINTRFQTTAKTIGG